MIALYAILSGRIIVGAIDIIPIEIGDSDYTIRPCFIGSFFCQQATLLLSERLWKHAIEN